MRNPSDLININRADAWRLAMEIPSDWQCSTKPTLLLTANLPSGLQPIKQRHTATTTSLFNALLLILPVSMLVLHRLMNLVVLDA